MATALISKPNTQAVRTGFETSSNPRFQPMIEATQFPSHLVAQCLSYLFPSTIAEFIDYFRTSNALVIPADQPFSIRDISLILGNRMENHYPKESSLDQLIIVLRNLLAPLGKGLGFHVPSPFKGAWSDLWKDNDLYFLFDRDVTLTVAPTVVECRISDLFRLMNHCSISELAFTAGQDIRIWGLSADEYRQLDPISFSKMGQLFCSRSLPGMNGFSPVVGEEAFVSTIHTDDGAYGLRVWGGKEFPLRFSKGNFRHFENADELLRYLDMFGEISLEAGQTLTVEDDRVCLSRGVYSSERFFILDQFLVQRGMLFEHAYTKEAASITWSSPSATAFSIRCDCRWILRPVRATQMNTTLEILSHALRHTERGYNSLSLEGGQSLHLFGLTEAEMDFFGTQCKADNLRNLFPTQNPTGFVWSIRSSKFQWDDGGYLERTSDSKKFDYLKITPAANGSRFELALERATGEELIANLVKDSHPQFLAELHDMDPAAMKLLLFRALLYYCCDDFRFYRSDELPDFFSQGTAAKIAAFLQDREFTAQRKKVVENPQYQEMMRKACLENTAAEFDQLDRTKFPPCIQYIFKTISLIADVGTQRVPLFLSRDLPNFLAKNPLPKAADKPASAAVDSKDPKK
jgi:hypothetical protein